MGDEVRIIKAMKASGVKRVVLLDDAFDPPGFEEKFAPDLLDYLDKEASKPALDASGLREEQVNAMKDALNKTEYGAAIIKEGIARLYENYRKARDASGDPGGMFKQLRGRMLADLQPLIELLAQCTEISVKECGRTGDLHEAVKSVDVIFADYYLMSREEAAAEGADAVKASSETLIAMFKGLPAGQCPSVVLMSSEKRIAEKADDYRTQIRTADNLIYASSFAFVHKNAIAKDEKESTSWKIADEAADALLEIFQTFDFGRTMHNSLHAWVTSAHRAVDELKEDLANLQIRDFAYLVKFRLIDEGEPLLDYLEWFFGECLLDGIVRAFDQATEGNVPSVTAKQASRVEGAFDGPTDNIADLYHRVRIASPRKTRPAINYKTGDLYVHSDQKTVSTIMTPECDLITRKSPRKATRILTVSGELKPLDAPDSTMAEFIRIAGDDGKVGSHSIEWKLKSIETHQPADAVAEDKRTAEHWPLPGTSTGDLKYVGSLRPLYAQALQSDLLVDLGRSSIPVAPALAMAAKCEVFAASADLKKVLPILIDHETASKAHCWAIHDKKNPTIIFTRTFAAALIEAIQSLGNEYVSIKKIDPDEFYERFCAEGVRLNKQYCGLDIVTEVPQSASNKKKAWLVITAKKENAEATA